MFHVADICRKVGKIVKGERKTSSLYKQILPKDNKDCTAVFTWKVYFMSIEKLIKN
jgi:hypothetical protein